MKKFIIAVSILFALPVYAQSNRATLQSDNSATFTNCGTHCITGSMLQNWNNLSIQSFGVLQDGNTWTGLNNFTGGVEINGMPTTFPTYQAGYNTALGLGSAANYAVGTSGASIPLLSGTNTWLGTQTFGQVEAIPPTTIATTGGMQPSNALGWFAVTRSGALTASSGAPPGLYPSADAVYIQDIETVGSTGAGAVSLGYNNALDVYKAFGVGNGVRTTINATLIQTAPTAGNTGSGGVYNSWYTGVFSNVYAEVNDGGTSLTSAKGAFFGYSAVVTADAGATNLVGIAGAEFDVLLRPGSSALIKTGLQILSGSGGPPYDSGHGSQRDAGIAVAATTGADAGFNYGLVFGCVGCGWALPSDGSGTIIGTYTTVNAMVAHNGVDFSAVTFDSTGCVFKSAGFCIGNLGRVSAAGAAFNASYVNLSLQDAAGSITSGALVRYGGNGSGTYIYQINTAVAGDFSSVITAYSISPAGAIKLPSVATGTPAASLCLDSSGNIIKKTTTGSCI